VNNTRFFFDNLIITLPDACHFDGDPQPGWEIRLKIGNRHRMLNLFQHAVTIAFFVFLQRSPCFENNTFLLIFLSILSRYHYKYDHAGPSFAGVDGGGLPGAPRCCASPSFTEGGGEGLPGTPGHGASPSFTEGDG